MAFSTAVTTSAKASAAAGVVAFQGAGRAAGAARDWDVFLAALAERRSSGRRLGFAARGRSAESARPLAGAVGRSGDAR